MMRSRLALAIAVAAASAVAWAQPPPAGDEVPAICRPDPSGQPIIDVHLHAQRAAGVRRVRESAPLALDEGVEPPPTDEAVIEQTIAALDRAHIVYGVLSGPMTVAQTWFDRAPRRFLLSFGFNDASVPVDAIRAAVASGRVKAIGELGFQYEGLSPADPSLDPYFAAAEDLDVPVGIHMSGSGAASDKFRPSLGNPLLLEEVLARHPKLRVWIMHAGLPFLEGALAMLRRYPQLDVDVSQIDYSYPREQFHEYLRALMRAGFGKRIMYGSDPTRGPHVIAAAIEGVTSAEFLSAAERQDILCANAARFFRLAVTPTGEPR